RRAGKLVVVGTTVGPTGSPCELYEWAGDDLRRMIESQALSAPTAVPHRSAGTVHLVQPCPRRQSVREQFERPVSRGKHLIKSNKRAIPGTYNDGERTKLEAGAGIGFDPCAQRQHVAFRQGKLAIAEIHQF